MLMHRPRIDPLLDPDLLFRLRSLFFEKPSNSRRVLVVSNSELRKILDKLSKLRALRHARERVRQLEQELCAESAKPEEPSQIPEFLSQHHPLRLV
jgi:hypothetical protein